MTFDEYIAFHKVGDPCVEEKMMAKLCKYYGLDEWQTFKAIYYYSMCYNLIDPFRLLQNPNLPKSSIDFCTDRRYVRIGDRYNTLLKELRKEKLEMLKSCKTTTEAYKVVSSWYYFGRFTAYLFLECWTYMYDMDWEDDFLPAWEKDELYTKGAMHVAGLKEYDKGKLDEFCKRAKKLTGSNAFSLETSLCCVAKILKGTKGVGSYTENLLKYVNQFPIKNVILKLL